MKTQKLLTKREETKNKSVMPQTKPQTKQNTGTKQNKRHLKYDVLGNRVALSHCVTSSFTVNPQLDELSSSGDTLFVKFDASL